MSFEVKIKGNRQEIDSFNLANLLNSQGDLEITLEREMGLPMNLSLPVGDSLEKRGIGLRKKGDSYFIVDKAPLKFEGFWIGYQDDSKGEEGIICYDDSCGEEVKISKKR